MGAPTKVEKPASLAARLAAIFSRHSVALVSLMVALSGLAYNTWRNETTEAQRSTRQAAFRMLEELGELQSRVNYRYFANDPVRGDRIGGWGQVLFLRGSRECETSYKARKGKYDMQHGIVLPRILAQGG